MTARTDALLVEVTLQHRRIGAALALHVPCHAADPQPYECVWGHYDDLGEFHPTRPAVCLTCTYDDRVVPYPCPTVVALTTDPQETPPL